MIAKDKLQHAAFGAAAAVGAFALSRLPPVYAMLLAPALVGIAYELVQKLRNEGVPAWSDVLATCIGGAALAALARAAGLV